MSRFYDAQFEEVLSAYPLPSVSETGVETGVEERYFWAEYGLLLGFIESKSGLVK